MNAPSAAPIRRDTGRALRIGSVSYLNAKPLIYGLDQASDVELNLDVPSRLLDGLRDGRFDLALLPVIDYLRMEGLCIVPAGGIGCDGPTLTVRIFSREPIEAIRSLACDPDSHTSVALARVILAERYGSQPEFTDLRRRDADPDEGRLLIGDKVVCEEPQAFPHQLDLGLAWKELTGLPFVFATWMTRENVALGDLPRRLEAARKAGLDNVERIIDRHAAPHGWPADVARRYLTDYLKFEIGPRQIEAMSRFHQLAVQHGAVDGIIRPLRFYA
jgi:chorismate dehydratase